MPNLLNPEYWNHKHPLVSKSCKIIDIIFKTVFDIVASIGWIVIIIADWPYMSIVDVLALLWFLLSCFLINDHILHLLNNVRLSWKSSTRGSRWRQLAYHVGCLAIFAFIIAGFLIGLCEIMHLLFLTGLHIKILNRISKIYAVIGHWIAAWI